MNNVIILLLVIQFVASGIGAYLVARQARHLRIAVSQAAAIAFLLPLVFYIIPFSRDPTLEKLIFFFEWAFYSLIINELTALPVAVITQTLKK